nr:hypothetical protein [uncultured Allomuricauda sp.]
MKTIKIICFTVFTMTLVYGQKVTDLEDQNKKFHTIKLEKDKNGYKSGAAEWITGGKDSVQNFMVKPLKLREPVYVTLATKFPQYELRLRCYTGDRENPYIIKSTKGEKFASHIFRVQSDATFGVESDYNGVPYLLYVTTGKPFPISDKPFLRIVSTEEEYNAAKKDLHISTNPHETGMRFQETSGPSSSTNENNGVLYGVIGFMAAAILFLAFFLFKKSKNNSKSLSVVLLVSTMSIYNVWSQDGGGVFILDEPPLENPFVLSGDDANAAVQNYNDRTFNDIPIEEYQGPVYYEGIPIEEAHGVTWELGKGVEDITGTPEALEMQKRMEESRRTFEEDFREKMPGEVDERGRNHLPEDSSQEQIDEMSRQIRRLQREVAFLRERDREFTPRPNPGVIVYCSEIKECSECYKVPMRKFNRVIATLADLQAEYSSNLSWAERSIQRGNAIANMTPGASAGWQAQLPGIMRSLEELRIDYNKRYDEFLKLLQLEMENISDCNRNFNPDGKLDSALETQLNTLYDLWVSQRIPR